MDYTQAQFYVSSQLGISDVERKLAATKAPGAERLQLLNEIIEAHWNSVPFHNLGLLCAIDNQQAHKTPSLALTLENGLTQVGGLCFGNTLFILELLEGLGYSCNLTLGSVLTPDSHNHTAIIACDVLAEGDRYLVEVGYIAATFAAIPLNIPDGGVTQEYKHSTQTFRYARRGDTYIRQHKEIIGIGLRYPLVEDGWVQAYFFSIKSYTREEIRAVLERTVYSNQEMYFSQNLRVAAWKNRMYVAIRNQTLEIETDDSGLKKAHLDTADAVIGAVTEHFPMIPRGLAERAVRYWSAHCEGARGIAPASDSQ